MAQGKMKVKSKMPSGAKQKSSKRGVKKAGVLKKGRLHFAPKQKDLVAQAKVHKDLTNKVSKKLEDHVLSEAKSKGMALVLMKKNNENTKTETKK